MNGPAGWYQDPQGAPTHLRYWDGRRWTEFTVSPPKPPSFPPFGSGDTRLAASSTNDTSHQSPTLAGRSVTRGWRVRHSLWILAPVIGFGFFSFLGFAYCAARVRTRAWTVVAVSATLLTVIGYILMATWTDSAGNPTNAATVYMIDLWLASIVFAFIVNRDYLTWRAGRA
jgi:hypothetical protein